MSTKWKTVLIIVSLLAIIGLFNKYVLKMDPSQLAARGVGKDPHAQQHEEEDPGEQARAIAEQMEKQKQIVKPIGPEDAEVTITVLWRDMSDLEKALRPMMEHVASTYEGHVRVEFPDPKSDEYRRLVTDVTKGVGSGLVINGEMIKEVPDAPLGMIAFSGSPTFEEWGVDEVRLAVEHELMEAGVEFTPKQEHDHSAPSGPAQSPRAGDSHAGHGH